MNYLGLRDLMNDLTNGGALDDWELRSVFPTVMDNFGEQRFGAVIALGPIEYRITSYIPPARIRKDIERRINASMRPKE